MLVVFKVVVGTGLFMWCVSFRLDLQQRRRHDKHHTTFLSYLPPHTPPTPPHTLCPNHSHYQHTHTLQALQHQSACGWFLLP